MLPPLADMFRQLIQIPSVSSNNSTYDRSNIEVVNLLANWLNDLGFETSVKPLESNPQKANLIARIGSGEGGLVLAGHTDTVPCQESDWSVNPYSLTEKDDKYFGLGTCDMKGFFPLVLSAFSAIDAKKLIKPLCIAATSDEETSMAGARELQASDFPKADAVVIGEPTDLVPAFTHKGMALLRLTVEGEAGHSSNPDEGNNAIDVLHEIIGELQTFRGKLRENYCNETFEVTFPTLNLGCVHAGDAPNRICSHAELQFDIRILPGMQTTTVLNDLLDLVHGVSRRTGACIRFSASSPFIPPFETDPTGDLVKHLAAGTHSAPTGVAFGTEAPFFQALGIETAVCGPGSIRQAHQPDEYLALDQIKPTQHLLQGLIHTYCV